MKRIIYVLLLVSTLFLGNKPMEAAAKEIQLVYGIGSVSKMFSTAGIMKLVDQGKVELDDFVTDYIPEFEMADQRYRQITVRMLLNHSSGLMGTTFQSAFLLGEADVDYHKILLDHLKKQKLKAEPGEYSVYCNDGFTLAEIIIERVSGRSFTDFIRKEITSPLGMNHTFMPDEITEMKSFAPIYYGNKQLPYQNVQCLGAGGMYSTAEDLCRFSEIFMEGGKGILSPEAVKAMAEPEYLNNQIGAGKGDSCFNYGLGWDSVEGYPYSAYGITALSKGGDTRDYSAGLTVMPAQKLSIGITASGGESTQCLMMAQEIITEVLKEEGLLTEEQEQKAVPTVKAEQELAAIPEELKIYEGVYAAGIIWKLEFTEEDTARITSLENGSDMVQEYKYTAEGNFVSTNGKHLSYEGMVQAADGISGITSFVFREESNGKTYMMGTTYKMSEGKGKFALTIPFAEKISGNEISDKVVKAWQAREGKKYYLISQPYNSSEYYKNPFVKVETMERWKGYTGAQDMVKNCRIVEENKAVCELDIPIMTGRDLADFNFYEEKQTEFLEIGGSVYLKEDAFQGSSKLTGVIRVDSNAQWYKVDTQEEGMEIKIEPSAKSAYFVFDKNDSCTASSLFRGERETILLPEGGLVLLVGEEGSTFTINR